MSRRKAQDRKLRKQANSQLRQVHRRGSTLDEQIQETLSIDSMGRTFKKHKFNVSSKEARTTDGIVFDSKWEMEVYKILKREIPEHHLHLQPKFLLLDKFRDAGGTMQRSIVYVGDFLLGPDRADSNSPLLEDHVLIDCKGMETDVFRIKLKLLMSRYGNLIHRPKTGQKAKVYDLVELYKKKWAGS